VTLIANLYYKIYILHLWMDTVYLKIKRQFFFFFFNKLMKLVCPLMPLHLPLCSTFTHSSLLWHYILYISGAHMLLKKFLIHWSQQKFRSEMCKPKKNIQSNHQLWPPLVNHLSSATRFPKYQKFPSQITIWNRL